MNVDASIEKEEDVAFLDFLSVNAGFWEKSKSDGVKKIGPPYVLIEGLVQHSGYMFLNAIIGRHMMNIKDLPGAVLLPDRKNKRWEKLFRSYGIEKFYYLSDRKKTIPQEFLHVCRAFMLVISRMNINKLLKLRYRGIDAGKIVYDTYLRSTGYGTMERLSCKSFHILVKLIGLCDYFDNFFASDNFSVLIQAERQFIPGAVLCQSALANGVEIISRGGGPQSFTLQRYSSMDDVYRNSHRHEKMIFDHVMQNKREEAVRVGGEIIEKRFRGESSTDDIPDAAFAFKKNAVLSRRSELCKRFNWEETKPIVAVMANMLTDGVFTNRWHLFKDNLVWLRETLACIREIDDVNWIVKGHPSDKKNKVKTPTDGECARIAGDCDHIKYLPDDIAGNSLPGVVDVVLTGHGSAGIEYSCFGIPCVIAGESLYSGRGFVHEPKTTQEYFAQLRNVNNLKKLDDEQIQRAKIFAYIYLVLSRVTCALIPPFSVFVDCDDVKLWSDAALLMRERIPQDDRLGQMMKIHDKKRYRHMLNYDWVDMI